MKTVALYKDGKKLGEWPEHKAAAFAAEIGATVGAPAQPIKPKRRRLSVATGPDPKSAPPEAAPVANPEPVTDSAPVTVEPVEQCTQNPPTKQTDDAPPPMHPQELSRLELMQERRQERNGAGNYTDPTRVAEAIALREQGLSIREIVLATGLAKETVLQYVPKMSRSDGLRRMHARRKAEGPPGLPAWKAKVALSEFSLEALKQEIARRRHVVCGQCIDCRHAEDYGDGVAVCELWTADSVGGVHVVYWLPPGWGCPKFEPCRPGDHP